MTKDSRTRLQWWGITVQRVLPESFTRQFTTTYHFIIIEVKVVKNGEDVTSCSSETSQRQKKKEKKPLLLI